MYVEERDIARILARQELSLNDVKTIMRGARYERGIDERFEYANELLSEAADYLPSYTLASLIRADISEQDAAIVLERNRVFFSRLVVLLPTLVQFFGEEARSRNASGIVSMIDDCHNDFHATVSAARRDRQLREAKEKITNASKLATDAAFALEGAERHFSIEFDRYRAAYYLPSEGPSRFLSDLIHELRMCSGVLDVVNATADIRPGRLFVYGNDERTTVVEWAYHMCTMWNGPKLVTTPGSDFATLCSFLFEAVSGISEESLAGAINRYSRSENRKRWDHEEEDENDNFMSVKHAMLRSAEEIQFCEILLRQPVLSDMARTLLHLRIKHEARAFEVAERTYGPRQVYVSQMNGDQWDNMLMDAVSRLTPEKFMMLDEQLSSGKSPAARDVELGKTR